MEDKDLKKLLDVDPLAEAEKITGKSYKEDDPDSHVPGMNETTALGFLLNIQHTETKAKALAAADDTGFSNKVIDYIRIIEEEGFEQALEIPFYGKDFDGAPRPEKFYAYWHPDGILLTFDTYCSDSVNGGKFYYNWITDNNGFKANVTSSGRCARHSTGRGGCTDRWDIIDGEVAMPHPLPKNLAESEPNYNDHGWEVYKVKDKEWSIQCHEYYASVGAKIIYAGDHDCREALRLHIRQLRKYGSFLPRWTNAPFLWLLHHMDTKNEGYDYKAINKERIAMLPEHIQKAINYGNSNYVPLEPIEQEHYNKVNRLFRKHQGLMVNVAVGCLVLLFVGFCTYTAYFS